MNTQHVTTSGYDTAGHSIGRTIKQELIYRITLVGNFSGGPNLKFMARLWLLHHLGRSVVRAAQWLREHRVLG